MDSQELPGEICCVCGKEVTGSTGTAHVYHDGKRFSLCCPLCLDIFQRAPARFARGEKPRSVVDDLLANLKWLDP